MSLSKGQDNICPICYETMNEKNSLHLSCNKNHRFHTLCIRNYMLYNLDFFIQCPCCREMNTRNLFNDADTTTILIRYLTEHNKLGRCRHTTRQGTRCKHSMKLLNYGYCHIHNKEYLPKEKYDIIKEYMTIIFLNRGSFGHRLISLDCAKKLLIKYKDINTLGELYHLFIQFYRDTSLIPGSIIDKSKFYEYHDIELPPVEWTNECKEKRLFI
jgi:hypothetical protein